MTRAKTLVSSLAALALLAALPGTAEARFGKKGSEDNSSKNHGSSESSTSKRSSSHSSSSSSSAPSSSGHRAAPAYTPSSSAPAHTGHASQPTYHDSRPSYGHTTYHAGPSHYGHSHHSGHYVHYGWGFGYYPYIAPPAPVVVAPVVVEQPVVAQVAPAAPAAPAPVAAEVVQREPGPTATLGVDAYAHGLGGTLGVNMAIEGQRWGIVGQYSSVFYGTDIGIDPETTGVWDLRLSYAVISGQHGRLRLEGGVNGIVAPDLSTLGPDAGVSLGLGLVGPLGVEAAAHATVLPHKRYDWNAGLTLALGHVGLRAGWKQMRLDDNGLTEAGVRYVDDFNGPYFGVGFAF